MLWVQSKIWFWILFFKRKWFQFRFPKVNIVTKEYVKAFAFCTFKHFAISASGEKLLWKKITEEESEEADEFHDSQKCLGQSYSKTFSNKKKFHGFCMFFKFKGSILRFFFRFFFALFFAFFFYSFLSAVITFKETHYLKRGMKSGAERLALHFFVKEIWQQRMHV